MSGLFWELEDGRRTSVLSNEAALETISSVVSELQLDDGKKQQEVPAPLAAGIGTTPSADPEMWQAIMASLEEQSKQRGRQLSRHLSDAAPDVAGRLRQQRSESVRCSPEGVTFFQAADPAEGGGDCGLVLPSFGSYPLSVRAAVVGQLCNTYLQNEAEQVCGEIDGEARREANGGLAVPSLITAFAGCPHCIGSATHHHVATPHAMQKGVICAVPGCTPQVALPAPPSLQFTHFALAAMPCRKG
jgi:hypothetical protein